MPPSTRQTHATLANAPPGSHAPSANHADLCQWSERGSCSSSPFNFMAKVTSPVFTTPTTPKVAAVAPADVVCSHASSAQSNVSYLFPMSQAHPQAWLNVPEIEDVQRPGAVLMPVCVPPTIPTPVLTFHKPLPDPSMRGQHIAHMDLNSPVQVSDHLPH